MQVRPAHTFPEGYFTLEPHHVVLWSNTVGAQKIEGVIPSVAIMMAFRGAGASIAEIMEHLNTDAKRVLFGEIAIDILKPIKLGVRYCVKTWIIDSERKLGRKYGVFDRVRLCYAISGTANLEVATVKQSWIIGRPERGYDAA